MNKINTVGKRTLKDDRWHDANGPIPEHPGLWDPPMTKAERHEAAVSDPDNPPLTEAQLAGFKRVARSEWLRHRLHMSREEFSAAYRIPLETLIAWRRHEAEPSATEFAYLVAIERDPEAIRAALARDPMPAT